MRKFIKAYKVKIKPTEKQIQKINQNIGMCRWLYNQYLFKNNEFEIMYMNKRVSYLTDYNECKCALNPPFSSVYITSKILPQKIVFEEIDKKDINLKLRGSTNQRIIDVQESLKQDKVVIKSF